MAIPVLAIILSAIAAAAIATAVVVEVFSGFRALGEYIHNDNWEYIQQYIDARRNWAATETQIEAEFTKFGEELVELGINLIGRDENERTNV